ncbi:hydrolase/acyltransferase [Brevibacillus dissolubilis]|uniref:hydrolase/acyltransferase n=1 Tax=Brevibacillus dissolubilis TaxID=1844116 RepID=UPI00111769AB|nr:hydrolase/acyltransferase [Brevibacillus dissolubilis]
MRYLLLQETNGLAFVSMPASYMYQLVALIKRLHKEVDKLTAAERPALPAVIAEFGQLEVLAEGYGIESGLSYVSRLEQQFAQLIETEYPLISLLTEIRALQAQLEYLAEEEAE